jgi:hypothetical protein
VRWGGPLCRRVVDDLVSPRFGPHFFEIASVPVPERMTGRMLGVLKSDKSGSVDPGREAVFIGRERHVDMPCCLIRSVPFAGDYQFVSTSGPSAIRWAIRIDWTATNRRPPRR